MNILCKDESNNLLEYFYQWDLGRKIVFSGITIDGEIRFHISNDPCGDAYLCKYTMIESEESKEKNEYIIDVPNILLTKNNPIWVYVYLVVSKYESETVCSICIPVIPRPEPPDYIYEDNYEFVDYYGLKLDVEEIKMNMEQLDHPVHSVNGKAGVVVLSPSDIGAVPANRTINGVPLTDDITIDHPVHSVNDKTGAVMLSASDVGAVPTSRKINGVQLTEDITISGLPDVSEDDNGKVPIVTDGLWGIKRIPIDISGDGYTDLLGMRRTVSIDLSNALPQGVSKTGKLRETIEGIDGQYTWTIEFDNNDRPTKIIDDLDGHVCEIGWWD